MYVAPSRDTFDALRGGGINSEDSRFFHDLYDRAVSTLDEGRRAFMDKASKVYRRVTSNRAAQIVRNLGGRIRKSFGTSITRLETMEEFQSAKPTMRMWVTSHSGVRQKMINGEVEGYGMVIEERDRVVGEKHYDWRRVMDGIQQIPEEGNAFYKVYHEAPLDDSRPLDFHEKVTVLDVWSHLDKFLEEENGEDPTSPYGADMG